ncbi:molybdate transport system substrate-binding protein [Methylobacillus rhizosphaerae]|uniref:Molybdate transport system substrate-binding protein n=1 Tax=Methylobacillus rhizosphaerae TaxID=551994 RepID=A0A238YM59_9PROT|nr:molybdate ABC transporter substrate-binding protein [Methylobacillus rhizosphaerae]SNR72110.1 molybdate transport system substrate-binding protein [Methylobacillus rhizosphaerae]
MKSLALCLLLSFGLVLTQAAQAEPARVAAAADLKFALEALSQVYEKQGNEKPAITYAASGAITTQISNGAPFELFLSADEDYVLRLNSGGFTQDEGVLYATGHLVIVAPKQSSLDVDAELKGLQAALNAGKLQRFAIANPEHAPYGRRAVEVLKHAGVWEQIQPRLVLGENVAQATQFAISGSTDGGIVALSLVKSPQLANTVKYAEIPESWHSPQRQRMVLLKNAKAGAKAFYEFLQQPAAREVFRQYGFALPGE